ncbi:MAG: hypothetical protein PHZ04_05120 [Patescibacteria group bacterium]|nr:hypothetical protein [Patescibacteria group bacterium]MDD5554176.1 hypothetical protein [Patescibacteria group bacterium]
MRFNHQRSVISTAELLVSSAVFFFKKIIDPTSPRYCSELPACRQAGKGRDEAM